MVNVGGRSKGCSTCRRRRVKCDESRPICKRCQRCGFECEGPKDIAFVEGKIVNSRRSNKPANAPRSSDIGYLDAADRMPLSTSLRNNEFEIYICYSRKRLLRGGPIDLTLRDAQLCDIIAAGTNPTEGQIAPRAILSFATVYFGIQHGQAYIIDKGYAMHGLALKQLNVALSDPQCYTRDEVILSVATLAMLECLVPTGPKYYLKHMIGLERLFELRDPGSFRSMKSCALFKGLRHMILFASLRTGKPSILARIEWKRIMRASCSDEEMQEQDLYDFLADCTVLVAERDTMLSRWKINPERAIQQREELKRTALTLLYHLYAWKNKWDSDERNTYSETSAAIARMRAMQGHEEEHPPLLLTGLEFSTDGAVVMLMFYNTIVIYVLRVLASIPSVSLGIYLNENSTQKKLEGARDLADIWKRTNEEHFAAEWSAALQVCRCIPQYMDLQSRLDSECSPIIHWAIMTAWETLRGNYSPEGRWMMNLLRAKNGEVVAKGLWLD